MVFAAVYELSTEARYMKCRIMQGVEDSAYNILKPPSILQFTTADPQS